MKNLTKMTLLSAALAAFLLPSSAQTTTDPSTQTGTPTTAAPSGSPSTAAPNPSTVAPPPKTGRTINQNKTNQDNRIANGVSNGSLTAGEAQSLDKKEGQINQEERTMKADDNGHLTSADKAALQQQQKQVSNQIYKDKHNSFNQKTPKSGIGKTEEAQQDKIAQGEKSGQLSAGEATKLENQEKSINAERHQDLEANGGKLTKSEQQQIKQQQKQVNKNIYKDKHNHVKR